MKEKLNIRHVNCTDAFLQAAGMGISYADDTALETVRNFINSEYLLRFLLQLGALLPLAICVAVSLNKRVDNYCLRLFCWNCAFVNALFAIFLGYRFVTLNYVYVVKYKCYYEGGEPQVEFVKADATFIARTYIDDFVYPIMNKWSAYSISISVVFVRYANYRACVSPLRFTDVLSMRNLWLAAAVLSDLLGVAVAMFDDLEYFDIVIDLRIQALVMAVVALGIWLAELVISLLTVVHVIEYLRKRSAATKQDSRNISKMTSFLLFSISPAIQLLPFVYTDVRNAWEDIKFYWFIECMDKFGDVANLPMEEMNTLTEQCGVDHGPISAAENLIMICVIINIWKPYIEAFTMLLLLPNYRRAFFSRVRRMLGKPSELSTTVAPPVSSHWATKTADARRSSSRF